VLIDARFSAQNAALSIRWK